MYGYVHISCVYALRVRYLHTPLIFCTLWAVLAVRLPETLLSCTNKEGALEDPGYVTTSGIILSGRIK